MKTQAQSTPPPEGLIIELVTPLTEAGDLDQGSLTRLVNRAAAAADGLFAGSPGAGEALNLPLDLRLDLLNLLLATLQGRLPLFFGITANSWEETRELALAVDKTCRKLRYPGLVFLTDLPLWYHSNRGLPQACKELLEKIKLPLILLNLPQIVRRRAPLFKRHNIRTHVFKKLAALPKIAGLVNQGEIRRFLNYHHAARAEFAFYEADEADFLTRPGTRGVVSSGAQLFPTAWQWVVRACLHPEDAADDPQRRYELWAISQDFLKMARLYRANPVPLLKAALKSQGVLASDATAPGTPQVPAPQKQKSLEFIAAIPEKAP